ncbi:MAG: PorT family protein [Paludibacteraceae bacterium]|nr:PorT family protein [Paludibacteraceae bacterium]
MLRTSFMRSFFLAAVLSVASLSCSYGQQLRRDFLQELSLGVNAGANLTKVSFLHNMNDRLYELGNQSLWQGVRFGFVARYIHQNHFGLQLELNYVQAGWSEKFHENSGVAMVNDINMQDVKLGRRLEYMDIPVLAHIYFGKRRLRFIVNMGPEIRFMTKYGEMKWNIPENDVRRTAFQEGDDRFGDKYHNVDYGLTGGGGFDVRIGKLVHVLVECRYSYGFNDLYDNNKANLFQRSNNQMLGLMGSVMVPVLRFTEKKGSVSLKE